MNNGYAGRGDIKIKLRPYKRLIQLERNTSLSNGLISKPSSVKALETKIFETPKNNVPTTSALPTIPIYACPVTKPCNESNIINSRSLDLKNINTAFIHKSDTTRHILKQVKKVDIKSEISHKFYLGKSIDESFDFEKEPPTVKIITDSNKNQIIRHHRPPVFRQKTLIVALFIILGTTGYVSVTTLQTNNRVKQALTGSNKVVGASFANNTPNINNTKKSTNTSNNLLSNYTVSADLPRAIYIDKLEISARILPMGMNDDNTLQSPTNILDTGWYTDSAEPGQLGAVLIDGHFGTEADVTAVFNYLSKLSLGDKISIETGDGTKYNYEVVFKEDIPLANVDMGKVLIPYNDANRGLNLITCSGNLISDNSTRDHRLIVYAVEI